MKTIHTIFFALFSFSAFAQFSDVDIRSSGPYELGWNESWTKTQMYIASEDAALWVTPQPSGFLDVTCNPKKGIPVNRNVSLQKAFDEFKSPARVEQIDDKLFVFASVVEKKGFSLIATELDLTTGGLKGEPKTIATSDYTPSLDNERAYFYGFSPSLDEKKLIVRFTYHDKVKIAGKKYTKEAYMVLDKTLAKESEGSILVEERIDRFMFDWAYDSKKNFYVVEQKVGGTNTVWRWKAAEEAKPTLIDIKSETTEPITDLVLGENAAGDVEALAFSQGPGAFDAVPQHINTYKISSGADVASKKSSALKYTPQSNKTMEDLKDYCKKLKMSPTKDPIKLKAYKVIYLDNGDKILIGRINLGLGIEHGDVINMVSASGEVKWTVPILNESLTYHDYNCMVSKEGVYVMSKVYSDGVDPFSYKTTVKGAKYDLVLTKISFDGKEETKKLVTEQDAIQTITGRDKALIGTTFIDKGKTRTRQMVSVLAK